MGIVGGCLCGSLRFELVGQLDSAVFCHCPMCRKAQGSAFTSNAVVKSSDFTWLSSSDSLKKYESSKGIYRCFCSICGSPIYKYAEKNPEVLRIRLGILDDDLEIRSKVHIYVSNKAPWYDISDDLPQYESTVSEGKLINRCL